LQNRILLFLFSLEQASTHTRSRHDVSEGENEALQRIHIMQTAADEVRALFSHTKTELVKYRSS
jgi:hypothetical protein